MKKLSLIFLLMAALCACTPRHVADRLKLADELIESRPDSSLVILQSIDTAELRTDASKAYYALLRTQAGFKNYQFPDTTTLIDRAVTYYAHHGSDFNRMRSLYYQSRILFLQHDYYKAMTSALPAYEFAQSYGNPYWKARTAELLADIYGLTHYYGEAFRCICEAAENYKNSPRYDNYLYSLCDVGLMYGNIDKPNRGLELLDSVMSIVLKAEQIDTNLLVYNLKCQIPLLIDGDRFDEALKCYEEISDYGYAESLDIYRITRLAWALRNKGRINEAEDVIKWANDWSSTTYDSACVYLTLSDMARMNHDFEKAILYFDSMLVYQNKEIEMVLNQSALSAQSEYFNAKAIQENVNAAIQKRVFWGIVVFLMVLLIISYIIYNIRIKAKAARIDMYVNEINDQKEAIKKFLIEKDRLTVSLEGTKSQICCYAMAAELSVQKIFGVLDKLCVDYFTMGNSPKRKARLFAKIQSEINNLTSNDGINN